MCNNCETPEEDSRCPITLDTFEEYTGMEILALAGMHDYLNEWMPSHIENLRNQEFKDKRCSVVLH